MPVTLILGKLKWEDGVLKANLGYITSSSPVWAIYQDSKLMSQKHKSRDMQSTYDLAFSKMDNLIIYISLPFILDIKIRMECFRLPARV